MASCPYMWAFSLPLWGEALGAGIWVVGPQAPTQQDWWAQARLFWGRGTQSLGCCHCQERTGGHFPSSELVGCQRAIQVCVPGAPGWACEGYVQPSEAPWTPRTGLHVSSLPGPLRGAAGHGLACTELLQEIRRPPGDNEALVWASAHSRATGLCRAPAVCLPWR